MSARIGSKLVPVLGTLLCIFVLAEVNYPLLRPLTQLAGFAMLGLVMVFLMRPLHPRFKDVAMLRALDWLLALATVGCFAYVAIQTEPLFRDWWPGGQALGNRAGMETDADLVVGLIGLLLVLEATRRAIGWTLPILSLIFIAYAVFGPALPEWLFPHRGYSWERIVSQTFLHSQGVFGVALRVMFTYVFLFVIFGALLERTGATGFIIDFARRLFRNSDGGSAKVAVISSGMMGSLSGSAVANTATTGAFTIPMMRSAGFPAATAAGVEAAASSGGALAPPVMGAGAYMMLEIVTPPVTYLEIITAAVIPAALYYVTLLLIVHFYAKGRAKPPSPEQAAAAEAAAPPTPESRQAARHQGLIFFSSFVILIALLVFGFTPFRAVSVTLVGVVLLSLFRKESRLTPRELFRAFDRSAKGGVSLIAAASCVGIIVGVVTLTGVGSKLPSTLLPLAESNLLLALLLLMVSTIILGMGLPSAVCYLLMATLIGPALGDMGIVPLAAHLFIFYFGMMSMVTPPVALAAYTAAAIADSDIMRTAFAAFRFALVGFALPFAFVLRPELLTLSPDGGTADLWSILATTLTALIGAVALAAAVAGCWSTRLKAAPRALLFAASATLLFLESRGISLFLHLLAILIVAAVGFSSHRAAKAASS